MDKRSKRFYEFDSFRIDLEERQLLRESRPVLLTPKVFDILLALVENNGHTLTKDELMERVWSDTFVEYGNLNRNVSTLRKVLGEDSHQPQLIKTIPKRGYRFEGNVREVLEEEEALTVEKRTNYRLSVRTDEESESLSNHVSLSMRTVILAASAVALIGFGLVWGVSEASRNKSHAVSAAGVESKQGTNNQEAFELYRKGRAMWQNRSVESLHHATIALEQAVRSDPDFALAHAALADAYAFDGGFWRKAEKVANEAIRLDPSLGEPHATIAFVRTFWDWNLREAEPHFKQAIALNPNYATAHQWFALNLAARTQMGAALAEMQRALELEPNSVAINADMCQLLYFSRKYDMAIDQCRKALAIDPNFLSAREHLYDHLHCKENVP